MAAMWNLQRLRYQPHICVLHICLMQLSQEWPRRESFGVESAALGGDMRGGILTTAAFLVAIAGSACDSADRATPECTALCSRFSAALCGPTCPLHCPHETSSAAAAGCSVQYQAFLECANGASDTCTSLTGSSGACVSQQHAYAVCRGGGDAGP